MLDGVTSTGTKPCRLRSRSHHRRGTEAPTTGCCAPVSVKPRGWSQDQTNELRMLQIRVASHNRLGCTIVQHVKRQIVQLCKSISWQKKIFLAEDWGSVFRCWTLSRHMSKMSATVATGTFSQFGSSDTFCAVISRFVSEWGADVFGLVSVVSFRTLFYERFSWCGLTRVLVTTSRD